MRSLTSKNEISQQRAMYEEAIRRNPNDVNAYYGLGAALSRTGMHQEARLCFRMALELQGDFRGSCALLEAASDQPERLLLSSGSPETSPAQSSETSPKFAVDLNTRRLPWKQIAAYAALVLLFLIGGLGVGFSPWVRSLFTRKQAPLSPRISVQPIPVSAPAAPSVAVPPQKTEGAPPKVEAPRKPDKSS